MNKDKYMLNKDSSRWITRRPRLESSSAIAEET